MGQFSMKIIPSTGSRLDRNQHRNASILRLKDALHPELAVTPVSRLIFDVQGAIVGDLDARPSVDAMIQQLGELARVFGPGTAALLLHYAGNSIKEGNFHSALKLLKELLVIETELLGRIAS